MSLYYMHRSAGRPRQETDFIQLKLQVLSSSNSACVHSPPAPSTCCFTHSGFYGNRVSPTLFQSGFSTRQTERLRIEAAQYRVKKKIKELEDEDKISRQLRDNCEECRQKLYQIAKGRYISHKMKVLSKESFERQLQDTLFLKDSITLLGEVIRTCLPPSASSKMVWTAVSSRMKEIHKECTDHRQQLRNH